MNRASWFFGLSALGIALGLILVNIVIVQVKPQPIEWLEEPKRLAQFQLESLDGPFDNSSLQGRWTIVMFGFLNCPDACPTGLSQLAKLRAHFPEAARRGDIQIIFVSVDPERDAVADIHRYVQHFDPAIQGVTGDADALTKLADSLGVQFKVSGADSQYSVAHSVTYSIIDSDGTFRGRFRPGFDTTDLAAHLKLRLAGEPVDAS